MRATYKPQPIEMDKEPQLLRKETPERAIFLKQKPPHGVSNFLRSRQAVLGILYAIEAKARFSTLARCRGTYGK